MTNKTLSLPNKAATPVYIPTAEEVAAYHAAHAKASAPHDGLVIAPSNIDWKYDAPVESRPFDLTRVPPEGSRNSEPVQAPAKVWGDPRLVPAIDRAGPQPLFTPPRGR